MALPKLLAASLLIVSAILLLQLSDAADRHDQSGTLTTDGTAAGSLVKQIDCRGACGVRCSKSSRPHLCKRACGTCCSRCNCVPPGTSGNQQLCPCYYNQTTHGGKRKCP